MDKGADGWIINQLPSFFTHIYNEINYIRIIYIEFEISVLYDINSKIKKERLMK